MAGRIEHGTIDSPEIVTEVANTDEWEVRDSAANVLARFAPGAGLSAIPVADVYYPDPADGSSGIQAAFDAGGIGTTVILRTGTYDITEPIELPDNPTIIGHTNAYNTGDTGTKLDVTGAFSSGVNQVGGVFELPDGTDPATNVLQTPTFMGIEVDGNFNCNHILAAPAFNARITNVRFHRANDVVCWLMGSSGSTDNNFIGWSVLSHAQDTGGDNKGNVIEIGRNPDNFAASGSQYIGWGSFIHTAEGSVAALNGDNINLVSAHLFDLEGSLPTQANNIVQHQSGDKPRISTCHIDGGDTGTVGVRLTTGSSSTVGAQIIGNTFVDTFDDAIRVVGDTDGVVYSKIAYNDFLSGLTSGATNTDVGIRVDSSAGGYEGTVIKNNGFQGTFTTATVVNNGPIRQYDNPGTDDRVDVTALDSPSIGDVAFNDGSANTGVDGPIWYDGTNWIQAAYSAI